MPPTVHKSDYGPEPSVQARTGYAATPLFKNVAQATLSPGIQPALVVCITFLAFVIMVLLALSFSFWHWRRAHRKMYEQIPEAMPNRQPRPLYYRRAQRKKPMKHVRWQSLILNDSPPQSASSITHLLSGASTRVNPPTAYPTYGSTRNRSDSHQSTYYGVQESLVYHSSQSYTDLPSTATTIDSAPMGDLTPPPIPKRSSLRRPLHLNLRITSPEMTESNTHNYHEHRQPTPYPTRDQLSPSPISAITSSPSSQIATSLRSTHLLAPQRTVLCTGRISASPGEMTPMTPLPPSLFSKVGSDEID